MPQHAKRDPSSMIELDPQLELNPSQWVGTGIVRSCRRISVAMIPVAPSIMVVLLIRPYDGLAQLALAALIAYFNAELLAWLGGSLFLRDKAAPVKRVRVSAIF